MKTFQNYPGGKAAAVAAAKEHVRQDQLIRGRYWDEGEHRGCSIGCDVPGAGDSHAAWADLFGVPVWFAILVDRLFEDLPDGEHIRWHTEVREAMPEGVDISPIGPELAARCLDRCIGYIGDGDEPWRIECRDVVRDSATILRTGRWLTGVEAARAARSPRAGCAVWAAETAKAAEAARAVWAVCAVCAAEAARAGRTFQVARVTENRAQRDDLLELLRGLES